ncbi:gag protease polyprotein [Tanacetum coccineum]
MCLTMGTHDDEAGSSRSKRSRQHETVEEVLLLQVHHEFLLWEGCNRDAKSRYNTRLAQLLPRHIYSSCVVNWDVLNQMGCDGEIDDMLRIRLCEAASDEEIFTLVAWIRAFNINEPIYAELCHEFYSTYEFDKVCADDELQTKKIIKFRLGGRAHSLTLLEFAQRLRLYQAVKLEEEGFNVYFEGGLHSDEYFNAQDYWLSISHEENLGLSRSHTSTIKNPILRVIHKMITYGLCQRTTGYDKVQKNDMWLLSMFDARHKNRYVNVAWLIARWMKRKEAGTQKEKIWLPITTRVLIDSEGWDIRTRATRADGVLGSLSLDRLEGQVNKNALADTGSDINTMPYWIYEQLGREDMKKVDRGITMINHTQADAMGILTNVLCPVGVTTLIAKFLIQNILIDRDSPIVVGRGFLRTIGGIVNTHERLFSNFDGFCHQTFRAARSDVMRNV